MQENKISLSSPILRSRVKKYDTYQNHGRGSFKGNSPRITTENTQVSNTRSNLVQPVDTSEVRKLDSNQVATAQENTSIDQKQTIQKIKPKTINYSDKTSTQNGALALQAVGTARIYENEIYPDNESTLYGVAKRKLSIFQKAMYGLGVLVLVFSAFVSIQTFITNREAKNQIATLGENSSKDDQGVSEGTGDDPSEEEVSQAAIAAYQVSDPRDPRYIRIPELGVLARIKSLGITPSGAVDAPKNIFDAGWFNGSVRPGSSKGSSFILGHVSGWTGPGVFKNINRLVAGSQFEIEKGNGEIIKYSVTKTEKLALDQIDMSKILSTEVSGKQDIKLMTCSGKYNKETKTFEDRFVVYAEEI